MKSSPLLPGATVGILGSGQLGRMLALAAHQLGYHTHVFSPDADSPAGQVADREIVADYEDVAAVDLFAQSVDVVTFEFENVPAQAAEACAQRVPVRPRPGVLLVSQDRLREKTYLSEAGFRVTPFYPVATREDLDSGLKKFGGRGVLKTSSLGYDGKGQALIKNPRDADKAWDAFGGRPLVLEKLMNFQKEISLVAARGVDGEFAAYPVFENTHSRHILDTTIFPARVPAAVAREALRIGRSLFAKLDVVGVLCIEFFLEKGRLYINELAPRTHNSGHVTIDACAASQFEQQVRAVCGLPLGSTEPLSPAAMANLLGDVWQKGEPRWEKVLAMPDVRLHLYGKKEPRAGRKMGHLTVLARNAAAAQKRALAARRALASA